ncbi:MAG TPA: DUF1207 domain-containing protein, partial [Kofleriaceae bacterium]|nr:DUF1207 domain-containing protein [Kofleriaceae bacterium]
DYRGSLPLEVRHGMVSARLRLSHLSDHLGDGFALDGSGVRGEVASHEWADLTIAAGGDFGRIYLGGGTILHAELPVTREVLFGGFEIGSAAPGFSPLLAVHWQTFGTKDFSGTLNVQAGLSFIAERRLDLVFVLTHGDNPYSQFFNRESIDLIAVELRAGL